jgi:hypothetical protein
MMEGECKLIKLCVRVCVVCALCAGEGERREGWEGRSPIRRLATHYGKKGAKINERALSRN